MAVALDLASATPDDPPMKALLLLSVLSMASALADPASPVADILKKSQDTYAALSSYSCTGQTDSVMSSIKQTTTFSMRLQRPGFYRVDWKSSFSSGSVWSDGTGDFLDITGAPQKMSSREMALGGATGVSGMAAATIPGTFFNQAWGGVLHPSPSAQRLPDEKIGANDCFVITSHITPPSNGTITTTLWIGQQDNLIHQTRVVMEGMHPPKLTDDQIAQALKMQNKPVTPQNIADTKAMMASAEKAAATQKGSIAFTQTFDDIVINKPFVAADFTHP
jgi:hypothetical protein